MLRTLAHPPTFHGLQSYEGGTNNVSLRNWLSTQRSVSEIAGPVTFSFSTLHRIASSQPGLEEEEAGQFEEHPATQTEFVGGVVSNNSSSGIVNSVEGGAHSGLVSSTFQRVQSSISHSRLKLLLDHLDTHETTSGGLANVHELQVAFHSAGIPVNTAEMTVS